MRCCVLATVLCTLLAGCSERNSKSLGSVVDGPPVSIASAQRTSVESRIVLRGQLMEKCPVAGCWFTLRDGTGTIKVDTKSAGFVVVNVPLRTTVFVAGRVVTNGTERIIEAAGVRY